MALPERLGRMNAASDQARQSAIVWSGWRGLNSRPLDPQIGGLMSSRAAERATTVSGVGGECRVIPC